MNSEATPEIHFVYPDPQIESRTAAAAALRRLSAAIVGHAATDEDLTAIAAWAVQAAARVEQGTPRPQRDDYQQRRYLDPPVPEGQVVTFSDRPISGPANPSATTMTIRREGDEAVGLVIFDRRFESSPGRAHGGMTAATFDDVMGYVNVIDGVAAYTLELTVRYVAPMPLHEPVEIRARTIERTERRSTVTAEAHTADGVQVATGRATFAIIAPSAFGL